MFKGNVDGNSVVKNEFEVPIIAQWIRVNPTRWRDRISLRVELYGCDYGEQINAEITIFDLIIDLHLPRHSFGDDVLQWQFTAAHGFTPCADFGRAGDFPLPVQDHRRQWHSDLFQRDAG